MLTIDRHQHHGQPSSLVAEVDRQLRCQVESCTESDDYAGGAPPQGGRLRHTRGIATPSTEREDRAITVLFRCSATIACMRRLARRSSARCVAPIPRPARLMKNSNIRRPDVIPFGLTRFEASVFAIVRASLVNSPGGGAVETVLTVRTQSRFGLATVCR